jgi:hypothetical protein
LPKNSSDTAEYDFDLLLRARWIFSEDDLRGSVCGDEALRMALSRENPAAHACSSLESLKPSPVSPNTENRPSSAPPLAARSAQKSHPAAPGVGPAVPRPSDCPE